MRVLVTGWPSFLHGEATAGDVLSMQRVQRALEENGIPHDVAWSPVFRPQALHLTDVVADDYTDVVFVCGPISGWQVEDLHRRFANCRRIAIGVSVVRPDDPAVTGFDEVLPRDGLGLPQRDLAVARTEHSAPVVGVVLAPGQPEYGDRGRHHQVHGILQQWLTTVECAPLELDTRLDRNSWRHCRTAEQFTSLISRTDLVITTRLHGLVFALSQAVPALAVDPVAGGGKVAAQAAAWEWPAVVPAEELTEARLDHWWEWCNSREGARWAASCATSGDEPMLVGLVQRLLGESAWESA